MHVLTFILSYHIVLVIFKQFKNSNVLLTVIKYHNVKYFVMIYGSGTSLCPPYHVKYMHDVGSYQEALPLLCSACEQNRKLTVGHRYPKRGLAPRMLLYYRRQCLLVSGSRGSVIDLLITQLSLNKN